MTRYDRRRRPKQQDTIKAATLALGVGVSAAAVAYYVGRLFLTRETLGADAEGGGKERAPSIRRGGPAGP